jgi:hypothetical protein
MNRSGLFDSLYYCDAVVGINTSAMIEAAIVGRPVLSVLVPEFAASQEGTLHFRHLLPENGGCLQVASTFEEHTRQLAAVLHEPAAARAGSARFVASFVRPHGLDKPCVPIVAGRIERYAEAPAPAPRRASLGSLVLRVLVFPFTFAAPLLLSPALRKSRGRQPAGEPDNARPAGRVRISKALVAVAAAPALAGTILAAAFAVAELRGSPPFMYPAPRNIAEAAGMGLDAEMLRMLRAGQDPTRPLPVGAHVISPEFTQVSALEAAVWSRRVRVVRLLEREGFLNGHAAKQHIACVAAAVRAREIVRYLFPEGLAGCDPDGAVALIQSRSR